MFDIKPALFIFQCTCSLATACLFYHIVFSLSRLFQKFFEKVFNFLSTRTLFFPCSLALSTDDLIIILYYPFCQHFFSTFFIFFYFSFCYTIYCGLLSVIYTIHAIKAKNMPTSVGIFHINLVFLLFSFL